MEFGMMLRSFVLNKLHFLISHSHFLLFDQHLLTKKHPSVVVRKLIEHWLVFWHLQICFFKLGMMANNTELHMLIPVWLTWTFFKGLSCVRKKNFYTNYITKVFNWFWRNDMILRLVGLINLLLILCCLIRSLGRESCFCDFVLKRKKKINVMCLDSYNYRYHVNCFKLSMIMMIKTFEV